MRSDLASLYVYGFERALIGESHAAMLAKSVVVG